MELDESISTALAWERALSSLKRSLSPKDLKRLQLPANPEDLVSHVETWRASKPGKTRKAISVAGQTISRIQRFNTCIDQLAQGSPAPATLLWGSIKFVLTIIQDVSEEYDKVCQALSVFLDSLPRASIFASAFSQSHLVQRGVHDLFVSVLHFWVKACKFYRRRAIWNFMRSTWNDYDSEFSRLEASITRAIDYIEKGALAEHIKDSKAFMSEQRRRNDVQDTQSDEQLYLNRLFAHLIPPDGDIKHYIRDHEAARQKRHPSTCEWILHHPKFQRWSEIPAEKGGQLWINAGPGFGKTVLASFIIDHFLNSRDRYEQPILLYFYFRDSCLKSNNATAAICSLVYQLHRQQEESRSKIETTAKAMYARVGEEGKSGFPEVWRRLSRFLESQTNLVLILDALDECEDNSLLLPRLLDLSVSEKIPLLMISRRQKSLLKYLEGIETLEITPGDVHHDIKAFVESKVTRNLRLSHPLVRNTVMESLLNQHNGMFLWVNLMLKELKACISVEEMQMTLTQVPSGLEGVYIKIVRRLEESLTHRAAETTKTVLTWVLGSARSLTMDVLREALSFQYKTQGHTLLSDGEFPYTEKDLENMCGSLISIRHGQIQTVHQSTKEYLVGLSEDRQPGKGQAILPTSVDTSLKLTSICLTYQKEFCQTSLVKLQMSPFDHRPEMFDIQMLQANNKLLNYSFLFWIHHVLGCPISHRESMIAIILNHFSNSMTVSWIVVSMLIDPKGLWRLVIGLEEMEEWLLEDKSQEKIGDTARHLQVWCTGTIKLLKAYSTRLLENPWAIWRLDVKAFLDPEKRFTAFISCSDGSLESEQTLHSLADQALSSQTTPRNPTLGHNQWSLLKARLGFFIHDRTQNIFLSGEKRTSIAGECLFVQHAESGKRLSPVTAGLAAVLPDEEYRYGYVITAKISAQGKYLAVAYDKWLSIWVIEASLKFLHRLRDRAWASRLISDKYHEEPLEYMTAGMMAFAGNDKLFVPGGWYDLVTKEFHVFRPVLSHQTNPVSTICYSEDCSYIFTKQSDSPNVVSRGSVSLIGLADSVTSTFELDPMWNIKSSNTGGYLVLFDHRENTMYTKKRPSSFTLFKMESLEMEQLPISEDFSSFGECSFHFSEGDETFVTFLWEPETRRGVHAMMTVTVWKLGSGQPKLCSQGQVSMVVAANPATEINPPIITTTARDFAWIVSCDRAVQIVKFNTEEISFPGYDPRATEWSLLYSQVSQEGYRFGIICTVDSKVHLEVINLQSKLQVAFTLERVIPNIERVYPISLSPKIDLLVLGSLAFIIDTTTNELSPPIKFDIDLANPVRDWDWVCTISSCGDFVAFDKPGYKHQLGFHDRQLGHSVIFRINRTERTAVRLNPPYHKGAEAASFNFHPFTCMAAFSSSEGEGYDNSRWYGYRESLVPANELSLSIIHLKKDELAPLEPLQMIHHVRSELYVADTGDFLLLEGFPERDSSSREFQSRIIVSELPYQSKPLSVIPANQYIHPAKDRSYSLNRIHNTIEITMYKFQSLADDSSLPAYQALESTAKVDRLTVFPSNLSHPQVWLLLGEDYSKPLKMLLYSKGEPLILKTLVVSWDELRTRLETTLTPA